MPGKRDTRAVSAISDALSPQSSGPSDINLDDEDDPLSTPHPHFTVPPLKPAVQPSERMSDLETPDGALGGLGTPSPDRGHSDIGLGDDLAPPLPSESSSDDLAAAPAAAKLGLDDENDIFASRPAHKAAAPKAADAAKMHATVQAQDIVLEPGQGHARGGPRHSGMAGPPLEGEGVTAAFFTGANQVEVQRNGRREAASVPASDLAGLGGVIRKLASKGSPKPTPEAAAVNTTLPDGMHVAAIFPPVADRLCVAIRRPVAIGKTIDDLVEEKTISPEMRQVLDACVSTRQNILVSGDRAACDSLLRSILWSVDRVARVALVSGSITPPASATSWLKLQPDVQSGDLDRGCGGHAAGIPRGRCRPRLAVRRGAGRV